MAPWELQTPCVLLVNDAREDRESYARTLKAVGYRAIGAETPNTAYQLAAAALPDIVVTDVRLGGAIAGLELTRRLRTDQRTAAIGIIVLTMRSRPQDAEVALKAGADAFIEKPVPGPVLKSQIARLLATTRRVRTPDSPRRRSGYIVEAIGRCGRSNGPFSSRRTCPSCGGIIVYRKRWPVAHGNSASPGNRTRTDAIRIGLVLHERRV